MAGGKRDSFEKFNYLLRPSKQVERKLLIEAFHCMRADGYDVAKYTYLGFGSVFYADCLLLHKYLNQIAIPLHRQRELRFVFL